MAVSLDIVNAFNSLPWARIREALEYHRVPPYLRRMVGAYLSGRCFECVGRCGNIRRAMDRGVPQGSVLGPLLWDIAYDAVLRVWLPPGVDVVCYADDTLILAGGPHWRRVGRLAEVAVARVVAGIRALGLEVAPRKTQAMWFCARGGRLPPPGAGLMVGGVLVEFGTEMNYLGLILDPQWRFGRHFDRLAPRLEATAGALSRLMPNLRGPRGRIRRLYAGVVRSMALYGAPIWADALLAGGGGSRARLGRLHRRMAIRVVCGYRTISGGSASALSALPPWDLEAARRARVYRDLLPLRQGGGGVPTREVALLVRQARQSLLVDWRLWLSEPQRAGSRAVAAILPCLEAWADMGRDVSYRVCQVFTGHGCFGAYLAHIGREATARCHHCGADRDGARHTLEVCPSWDAERAVLVGVIGGDLSLPAVVRAMVGGERSWRAVASFCERVMLQKEAAERERIRISAPGRIGGGGPGIRGRPGRRAYQP